MKIAILGAGITGLAVARTLLEGGVDPSDVQVLEAAGVAGGLCGSKTVDGFTYDVAGGHILYSKDKVAMEWMKEQAGGPAAFVERRRETKIRFGDRWVHYPFENGLGDLPQQANYDCLKGYVEAWHARRASGSAAPADFAGWVRWRFGDGIARHFMDPYNEKIWKRPLAEITSDWVAGRVPDAPIDDVLKSSIGIRTEGYTHQSIFYYPLEGGFQAITDGFARRVGKCLRLNRRVERVEKRGARFRVDGEEFDAVVSTLALNDLPSIVAGMPDALARETRALSYNSLYSLLVALDRPEHPNLSWIYLPHHEQGPANRVTYMSNYSPRLAPSGKTSLMCEVTYPSGATPPGPETERAILQGLEHAGLIRRGEVLFTDHSHVRLAYIVYDAPHAARRKHALDWLEAQGIDPIGRFGRYDYDNSDQCVIKARALGAKLLARAQRG